MNVTLLPAISAARLVPPDAGPSAPKLPRALASGARAAVSGPVRFEKPVGDELRRRGWVELVGSDLEVEKSQQKSLGCSNQPLFLNRQHIEAPDALFPAHPATFRGQHSDVPSRIRQAKGESK